MSSGQLSAFNYAVQSLESLRIKNISANYTIQANDLGLIINCTANTFTVSLTAAATLGAGFNVTIWNTSTTTAHAITIASNGTETIDGLTTLILRRGEGMQIVCDGTNWQTGNKKTMRAYAENYTPSSTRPVATGSNSVAIGNSSASGSDSFAASITDNSALYGASSAGAVALSRRARATNNYALALGNTSVASGSDAIAIGASVDATGANSVSIGYFNQATGASSVALGVFAKAVEIGKFAFSSAYSGAWNYGFQQYGMLVLIRETADATSSRLTCNAGAASTTNQVILQNNSAFAFTGIIVSRRQASGGTESAAWRVEGLIRREGTAASTTLVASTVTAISNAPGWTLALSADTTNGGLAVTFTGAAATNIRTVATIQTSEVTYN